jgi:hypothetical protein
LVVLPDTGGLITRSVYTGPDSHFDVWAPAGFQVIDRTLVAQDLELLGSSARPVKLYTGQIIAHRQQFGRDPPPLELQFREIDHALAIIGQTIQTYWMLVHPKNHLTRTTPVEDHSDTV